MEIMMWYSPQYVHRHFGGKVRGWRVAKGVYLFRGDNGAEVTLQAESGTKAREALRDLVIEEAGIEDGRTQWRKA